MPAFLSGELVNDGITVLTLIVLEGLLSADNALVLAVMVRHLPDEERGKALKYGIFGAFFFRAIGVLLAGYLVKIWWLKMIGALYLIWLAASHFWKKWRASQAEEGIAPPPPMGFWRTVLAVELTDIAFSLDSIVAAVAMSPKLWVVYTGGILGIITMRFVAGYFLKLLDTFHALETSAYLLVSWIGLKLALETYPQAMGLPAYEHGHGPIPKWLFWSVMLVLFFGAFLFPKKKKDGGDGDGGIPAVSPAS